jgi:hypothetical protein
MAPNIPLRGSCGCGAVQYQVTGQPLMVTMCHCTLCQARTGSAFSMNMVVRRPDLSLVRGETITRRLKTGSGNVNVHHFCEECLVRTHTEPLAHPVVSHVRPGTLEDPRWITPIAQIWTKSAHPWAIAGVIRCFDENPPDPIALARAWQEANA